MLTVTLPNGRWYLNENAPLGRPGGFGAVFSGMAQNGLPVAIKRLHNGIAQGGHRELELATQFVGREHRHVIPVLDVGIDSATDGAFIVMAKAESSLRDILQTVVKVPEEDVIKILIHIVAGLREATDIVHRDLKPENILKLDGRWQLADFGIARLADADTSMRTLRQCLTPPYAAPEQWNNERATHKTDIYALGCIGVELLTGQTPFLGPTTEDFARQHRDEAADVGIASPVLKQLLQTMLRKQVDCRPDPERVATRLAALRAQTAGSEASKMLAEAGARHADQLAEEETAKLGQLNSEQHRKALGKQAIGTLREIACMLFDRIEQHAMTAIIKRPKSGNGKFPASLGSAELLMSVGHWAEIPENLFASSSWNVICGDIIEVRTPRYARSASLWYVDTGTGTYRWIEAAYWTMHRDRDPRSAHPCGLEPGRDAALCASQVMHTWNFAAPPKPIDDENIDQFCERWMQRLALAADGKLAHPSRLPEE